MKNVLSFGGGRQTIALVKMADLGQIKLDEVIFANTGVEKPETYWYIEKIIKPMLQNLGIPFIEVSSHLDNGNLFDHCWRQKIIPSVIERWCTDKFKVRPIEKYYKGQDVELMIGFSTDECQRADNKSRMKRSFPLLEKNMSRDDCVMLIEDAGMPQPLKSSCYFCVYQKYPEFNWLKLRHPDLVEKSLALEQRHYERYPHLRNTYGLLSGTPLWRWGEGAQSEMIFEGEQSCWSGHCGH